MLTLYHGSQMSVPKPNAEAVLNTYYVVACRRGKDYSSEYDIVEGGVANDNVIDTVEDYEKGIDRGTVLEQEEDEP